MKVMFKESHPLILRPGREGEKWVVVKDWQVVVKSGTKLETITIPAGFRTDLASVPRLPFAYWLTGGTANRPAVLHDYIIYKRPWGEAADIFLAAMKAEEIGYVHRYSMYWAVKAHGMSEYAKSRYKSPPPMAK